VHEISTAREWRALFSVADARDRGLLLLLAALGPRINVNRNLLELADDAPNFGQRVNTCRETCSSVMNDERSCFPSAVVRGFSAATAIAPAALLPSRERMSNDRGR